MSSPFFKIFFATDIHGSTSCFRKFINAALRPNPPDALILGGDITGKFVIPFVEASDGMISVEFPDRKVAVPASQALILEEELAKSGCYVYRCDSETYQKYSYDEKSREEIARKLQIQRIKEWMRLAEEKLAGKATRVLINVGNDDPFFIDKELQSSSRVEFPDNRIVALPQGLTLLSIGHSNPTPWHCPRELPEEQLQQRIAKLANQVKGGFKGCIFNFHCPPKDTQLDLAPKLDASCRPQVGLRGQEFVHVGSTAVRKAIENFRPLLSLHGHIHEQHVIEKLGETVCANPGSSYWTGSLQGLMITFKDGKLAGTRLTSERTTEAADGVLKILGVGLGAMIPGAHPFVAMAHQKEIEDLKQNNAEIKKELHSIQRKVEESSQAMPVTKKRVSEDRKGGIYE